MGYNDLRDIGKANPDFRQLAVQRVKCRCAVPAGVNQCKVFIALQEIDISSFKRIIRDGYFELIDTV